MITHFDHAYSFAGGNDLERALDTYAKAGFVLHEARVRHPAGQKNGFVRLTDGYLEIISIVDADEFARDATAKDRMFCDDPRPFGVVAITEDDDRVHAAIARDFPEMRAPERRGEQGGDGKVHWSIAHVPSRALPGVDVVLLRYLTRSGKPQRVYMGTNSIYAFGGFVLASDEPERALAQWHRTLHRISDVRAADDALLLGSNARGPQRIDWMTKDEHRARFGASWDGEAVSGDALMATRLLCESLHDAEKGLKRAGFAIQKGATARTFYARSPRHLGQCFVVEERGTARALAEDVDRQRGIGNGMTQPEACA